MCGTFKWRDALHCTWTFTIARLDEWSTGRSRRILFDMYILDTSHTLTLVINQSGQTHRTYDVCCSQHTAAYPLQIRVHHTFNMVTTTDPTLQ